MSRLLVALQFGLIALMVVRTDPARIGVAFAILLAAGLAIGLWAISANRPGNFNIRPEPTEPAIEPSTSGSSTKPARDGETPWASVAIDGRNTTLPMPNPAPAVNT